MPEASELWYNGGMGAGKKYRIVVDTRLNMKAVRDRCSGFLRYATERSLPWDIQFSDYWESEVRGAIDSRVLKWKPDGIFLNSRYSCNDGLLKGIPNIVAFGGPFESSAKLFPPKTVLVGIDNGQIAAEAFRLLARRGLIHFAYVHPTAVNYGSELRYSKARAMEFKRLAEESGFDCAECELETHRTGDWAASVVALAKRLSALPHPCGVMAYNDQSAREVVDACNHARLRIPEQIQVVGVDNQVEICENIMPRLTTIEPDFFGVGRLAAQRMDDLLTAGQAQRITVCEVLRTVERDTTRDLSGSARLVTAAEKLIHSYACQGLPPCPKGLTVQSLAAALHVSRSLLELRFGSVRGEGVAAAIRQRKLEEVCRMLRETDLPIGEIAERCGFPVQSHLNALFRRVFGSTLRDYRAAQRPPRTGKRPSPFPG